MKMILLLFFPAFFLDCGKALKPENLIQKEAVRRVDLRDVITQTGEIRPVVKVELKCEASGKIDTIFVKEGEALKKGQKILRIDPTQILTKKSRLDLALRRAMVERDLAKRDYENAAALFSAGSISRQTLQDLKSKYDLAELSVTENKLNLKDTEYELSKCLIVSPMEGVLLTLLVEEGEIAVSATMAYSGGTSIGTVADVTRLEVVTQLGEADYAKVHIGQKVSIGLESNAGPKAPGTVTFVSRSAKKETGSTVSFFEVRTSVDSLLTGLLPGENVSVDFVLMEKKGVLGVPYYMVVKTPFRSGEACAVFRPAKTDVPDSLILSVTDEKKPDKKTRQTPLSPVEKRMKTKQAAKWEALKKLNLIRERISVGETDYRFYEVLSGLAEGDTVVKPLIEKEE